MGGDLTGHIVIGTAGHVDHGKTALVRALTGVDTDRWAEEKRRGITIDLGFAQLDLGDGRTASVVDVPGHEDFVRNMVAGATGIDLALLVVAADEGVMPQTAEHVAILELLGIPAGVVAIAKTDLVETEWLDLVIADVRAHVERSPVAWRAFVPVSAVSGDGVDALVAELRGAALDITVRDRDDLFRLPVDRVFTVAGTGTVVTGTVWTGSARVGDEILVGERRARVRAIEVHGRQVEEAVPGRRTALALAGIDRTAVARGDTVVKPDGWVPTARVDALVTVLPSAPPLTARTRVRVHLGTAEVLARVTPAQHSIPSGSAGAARLRLESPLVVRWGDRAVLRSYSPVTTIAGAVVVDPWPTPRPGRPAGLERLTGAPVDRLTALVGRHGRRGVELAGLPVRLGIRPRDLPAVVDLARERDVVAVGERLLPRARFDDAKSTLLGALDAYHREEPQAPGMPREALRRAIADSSLAEAAERDLAAQGAVVADGAVVRRRGHEARLGPELRAIGGRVRNALRDAGFEGVTVGELAAELAIEQAAAGRVADFLVMEGTAAKAGGGRYYDRETLGRLVQAAVAEIRRLGQASPAQLRDALGLTRKYLIPLLEWLDAEGYTTRVGDVRRPGARLTKDSGGV